MTRQVEIEETYFNAGMWYYRIRALPIKVLKQEYGPQVAKLLQLFESYSRLKWEEPSLVQWDFKQFKKEMQVAGLKRYAKVYRGMYGLPVIFPISRFFYDAFSSYPNLNVVYGERGSGKTIFGWVTAYEVWKRNKDKYDDFQIYVYGDVDGITEELKKHAPDTEFRKALIFVRDYTAPEPESNIGKFILYNELDETLMSSNALAREQQAINKMIFRSRHYQYWMFYNVIRYKSIMKTVRITSSFQSFKPLSQKLLEEVVENAFPRAYRNIMLQALGEISYKQALVSIPLYRADKMGLDNLGSRQFISIVPVDAPRWLLKAASKAKKMYNVGGEYIRQQEQEMVKIAAEKYLKGVGLREIAQVMQGEYGFKKSRSWWHEKLVEYFMTQGYEFTRLDEVRNHVEVSSVRKEVFG